MIETIAIAGLAFLLLSGKLNLGSLSSLIGSSGSMNAPNPATSNPRVSVPSISVGQSPPKVQGPQSGEFDTLSKGVVITGTGAAATVGIGTAVGSTTFGAGSLIGGTVVPIVGAAAAVAGVILGIISAHHKAAVQAEANALNRATPYYYEGMKAIILAFASRQISLEQAHQLIDQEIAQYFQNVAGIIHPSGSFPPKSGAITSTSFGPFQYQQTTDGQPPVDDAGQSWYWAQKAHFDMNGPAVVAADWIVPDAIKVRYYLPRILAGRHGEFWIAVGADHASGIPAHAGFQGIQGPIKIRY